MTRILIDSGIDQNEAMRNAYKYEFIPLSVILDDVPYLDEEEIQLEEVYAFMRKGKMPKTSQASVKSIIEALDRCREDGEDAIYLSLSSKFSGTYQLAYQVFAEYQSEHPDMRVTVIDTGGGSDGGALIAAQAMEMAKQGIEYDTIVAQTKWNCEHVHYAFTLDDLDWLVKGGRLPNAAGKAGTALNIKPYLTVKDKAITIKKIVRGQKRVHKKILNDAEETAKDFPDQSFVVTHCGDEPLAEILVAGVKERFPEATTHVFRVGALLGSHLGIGGGGIFYFDEKPAIYYPLTVMEADTVIVE
ncbi:DegV family protein [Lacticigenium naphthae]|uniref:DegV family protein n=1 Tax=Lacticigenium naphthae TaxID=515351 RepID=UPI0004166607|nr:DegV family protein [Lacticigenium naphthae]